MIVHKWKPQRGCEDPYILCRPKDDLDLYPVYSGPELEGFGENDPESPDMKHRHWSRTNCRECFEMDTGNASSDYCKKRLTRRLVKEADVAGREAFMEELRAI